MEFKIGKKTVGDGHPTYVIAEAGSNHNGRLDLAKKLIGVAADAGADAVKFQVFRADKLYVPTAGTADYLKTKKSVYDIIKEMEMPYGWLGELIDCSRDNGIDFLASAFDEESADALDRAGVPAFKIASYELNHVPLIEHVAKKGKPMIMSAAGFATYGEIEDAIGACRKHGNGKVALMHCVAKYPAPLEHSNLLVIRTLKQAFGVPAGWSDHTADPVKAPELAVMLGANLVEKHFTLDRSMPGPDHKYALEPRGLKEMVGAVRRAEKTGAKERERRLREKSALKILGSPVKRVTPVEEELYRFAKRYIYAIEDIRKGERISAANVRALRPGKNPPGLAPKFMPLVIGRKAASLIRKYSPLTLYSLLQD